MTKARQLPLDLTSEPGFGEDDLLVVSSNAAAWRMIDQWPQWTDRVLMLRGPAGSGKSHLGAIWAARAGARRVAASDLSSGDLAQLASGCVLLEDADSTPFDEALLFHFLNMIRAGGGWLLITARSTPDVWGLHVRDLLSRLRLAPSVEILAPDDALVRAVLVKLFLDRQIVVDAATIDYLALHIERSLDAARQVVAAIDREALSTGRNITRAIAAQVLRDPAEHW